ncbi:peptidoglycan-associated lipoprotein Pal [Brevundimonas lenta]|uniref:Peptidoglycan-associated lipoprotein n=1 Tax=Brevundimonas lenta TaxID=424796 RepID=A0A7W6JBK8_9CAUL|nr:peptidoglycan-associated lipoprotein Pal [Brevundimonas lenta]MBB4082101.1 peptidoglycan-associated lipoprotein [Brevundimonas lenta]
MLKPATIARLAAVSVAVAAIAACTPRPAADTGAGNTVPPPSGPQYPTAPSGPVDGGNLGAATPGSEQDFVVNVGDRVYFDLDSYSIRSEAFPRLDAQVAWLQRYPNVTIRIEGNADERGTREYNLALGARRAESVRTYLVERGVNAGRIDTISFGKERPIAAGSNEEAWARNRNAHTAIVSGATR